MGRVVLLDATDLPPSHAKPGCRLCGHRQGYLGRIVKSHGATAIRWVCDRCEDYRTAGDLPKTILPDGTEVSELPLRLDHSDDDRGLPPCAVCDQPSEEFHHWAPVAIFTDWPGTVGVYLCTPHHREWHDRMRAHGLRWPHEQAAA